MKFLRSGFLQTLIVLLLAAAWKGIFIFGGVVPFNADEAVVGLMARHILLGERPVFFYGQAYMGSLDGFLIAGGFAMLGQQVWVIRLVQLMLYLGVILTTILIGREVFQSLRHGLLAGLLLAIPTVNVTLYTTASLGGYGEALLSGSLALLLALTLARRCKSSPPSRIPWGWMALWGILAGFGLWANGLSLVFTAPAGLYLFWKIWRLRRRWLPVFLLCAGLGFAAGALPWWLYALANGPDQLIAELFGTAVAVEKTLWLVRTGMHLVNFLLLGISVTFGFRPPWSVDWLALPLMPFALLFWIGVIWFFIREFCRKGSTRAEYSLIAGVIGFVLAGFLFTAFGIDPSGRYFLPMAIPLALFAAQMILAISRRTWQNAAMIALVLGFQAWGTIQCALAFPPGLTTQFYEPTRIDHRAMLDLIAFLRGQGETRGYTNYWVAYPLAFQSNEELIFIPRLPYHLDLRYTPRDDRYAPYTEIVNESARTAYITTNNPALDEYLRAQFTDLNLTWSETKIGDYQVYYHLSQAVRPQEIGLGVLRE